MASIIGRLTRDSGCDVELEASDGKVFKAHWVVLGSRLTFFSNMWTSDTKKQKEGKIAIAAPGDAVEFVVRWVYNEKQTASDDMEVIRGVLSLADSWGAPELARAALSAAQEEATLFPELLVLGWAVYFDDERCMRSCVRTLGDAVGWKIRMSSIEKHLTKQGVPELGIWGVKVVCSAFMYKQGALPVDSEKRPTPPPLSDFDISQFADLHLVTPDGGRFATCRLLLEGCRGFDGKEVKVAGDSATVGNLTQILNGRRDVEKLSVEEFKAVYRLAYRLELNPLMEFLDKKAKPFLKDIERCRDLLLFSAEVPKAQICVVAVCGAWQVINTGKTESPLEAPTSAVAKVVGHAMGILLGQEVASPLPHTLEALKPPPTAEDVASPPPHTPPTAQEVASPLPHTLEALKPPPTAQEVASPLPLTSKALKPPPTATESKPRKSDPVDDYVADYDEDDDYDDSDE